MRNSLPMTEMVTSFGSIPGKSAFTMMLPFSWRLSIAGSQCSVPHTDRSRSPPQKRSWSRSNNSAIRRSKLSSSRLGCHGVSDFILDLLHLGFSCFLFSNRLAEPERARLPGFFVTQRQALLLLQDAPASSL